MKRIFFRLGGILLLVLPISVMADVINVAYQIGPYNPGGYSASWLHHATHCSGSTGANSGRTLYKCDGNSGDNNAVTGTVSGTYDTLTGIFTIDGGELVVDGMGTYGVSGGSLGGSFGDGTAAVTGLSWSIIVDVLGTFYFEDIGMDPGGPTVYDADQFILWGQNGNAYECSPGACANRWGIDLYGERVPVAEPGILTLLGLGLLTLGARRRRT